MKLAWDTETNGLIDIVSKMHCSVTIPIDSDEVYPGASEAGREAYPGLYESIEDNLARVSSTSGNTFVGHNIVGYDIPVTQKLYPEWTPADCEDTLILAKMIWNADQLMALDYPRWRRKLMPGNLIKRHSLEAWGYRLGLMKGEYAKDEGHDTKWLVWRKDMQDYGIQDVRVTKALYLLIRSHLDGTHKNSNGFVWPEEPVKLEHDVQRIMNEQESVGVGFDQEAAIKLSGELKNRQEVLEKQLKEEFGSWWITPDDPSKGCVIKKTVNVKHTGQKWITKERWSEKTGKQLKDYYGPPLMSFDKGFAYCRIKRVEFNAKSRQHLGKRLQETHGWVPEEFGGIDGSQAKLDETILRKIPASILGEQLKDDILEYFVVSKTLAQLSDGKKNWLDMCDDESSIHGRVDPLGAISHRGVHFNPNLGQVPAVSRDKDDKVVMGWKGGFGYECRSLFIPRKEWTQVGTDASGLELRMLGHYLYPYDKGEFMKRVTTPGLDIHAENAKVTSLSRDDAKTVIYKFIYGGGPQIIGESIGVEDHEIDTLANSREAKSYIGFMKKIDSAYVEPSNFVKALIAKGSTTAAKFRKGITGIAKLKKDVSDQASSDKFVVAIDGRKLGVRKKYAALNLLLQGAGAIVCKVWMVKLHEILKDKYTMRPREDYNQMLWIHDELQFECRPGLEDKIIKASHEAMTMTQNILGLRGDLGADCKVGTNWAECH